MPTMGRQPKKAPDGAPVRCECDLMLGLGLVNCMTFSVTLLREQGLRSAQATAFYIVLGVGVMVSSWLWSGLLQRARGRGVRLGRLFKAVFLSLAGGVDHCDRAPQPAGRPMAGGIAASTGTFAVRQIAGPSLVSWLEAAPASSLTASPSRRPCWPSARCWCGGSGRSFADWRKRTRHTRRPPPPMKPRPRLRS